MRRILLFCSVLLVHVTGYSHAPGTYPEEETRDASEFEVPKNPYQSGWTGYEYYYEKEPKKMPSSSGKMPAFQSIQEVSTDRESPDDPEGFGYKASGAESSGHKVTTTTSTTTTRVPPVEVAPSSTTGTVSTSTTTAMYLETSPPTTTTTTEAPAPDTGDDLKAAENLAMYPGVEEQKKDDHEPKNLLTKIFEKKKIAPIPPNAPSAGSYDVVPDTFHQKSAPGVAPVLTSTKAPKNPERSYDVIPQTSAHITHPVPPTTNAPKYPEGSYDSVPESSSYGANPVPLTTIAPKDPEGSYDVVPDASSYGNAPIPPSFPMKSTEVKPKTTLKSGDSYDDLGGPSGYTEGPATTKTTPVPSAGSYDSKDPGSAPGAHPKVETTTRSTINYGSSDFGYGSEIAKQVGYEAPKRANPAKHQEYDAPTTSKPQGATSGSSESSGTSASSDSSGLYDIPFKPSPVYMHTDSPSPSKLSEPKLPESDYGEAEDPYPSDSFPVPHGYERDTVTETRGPFSPELDPYPAPKIPMASRGDTEDPYAAFSKPFSHIGTVPSSKFAPGTAPEARVSVSTSNSNNAISPRDPYDHFGTVPHPPTPQSARTTDNGDFEDERDGGYETNGVVMVPDRSAHSITTGHTDVRAQISEIDRIAESFENSAREPVEYEHKITSESSKGIIAEAGKDIAKKFGRKARKCCSCCDEKQPVSRQVETKVEPSITQKLVQQTSSLGEEPVQNFVPLQSTVGGSAYVQPQPIAQQPQTQYQQPFQQYQSQYPQSYPYQQPQQSCGCQPQPQNCCAPPAPCCLPTIPCCPPIPCCPQPKICCQPQPVCLPPPTCCQINFQLPTIPICGRACPSCPCRRRVHKTQRLKRHALSSNCNRCSSAGEPWKALIHHREKRHAPGCSSGFSTMSQNSCSSCGASHLRSPRVKRMGCLPCLGRKKRDTEENSHIRVKRMGCLPCLGRKKRSALSNCSQCNSLGHLFNRYKRSLFGCSPCQPSCSCSGRKKRSVSMKIVKRAPINQCDATCCDYSKCPNRKKKDVLVPFM